ncbi:early endosome antigen 1-like isoform X2 [Haliotis rubra]|uniref:early endosome antigen 1-like isoform X2 n=1 Tax=Haliotis rubra TaxID=36100 RepID=UPI001EE52FA6|nr:early endosome antigen 1-like isoform X2 [Haliotis rubra]
MDHFSFASILHDKENTQTKKILRESQTGVNSPRRTPLGNVRNKLPTDSYAFNIRKTLYGTPTSSTKWKSPLSSVSSKKVPVLSVSQDVITKPQSALKQHAGQSDKKKVVRFSLKNQLYSPVPLMKTTADVEDNADDKLDKETEDKSEDNLNEVTQNITEDKLDEVDAEDKLDKDSKADEEDKLDKEIEGFISSILRHTVDEIRNEYQTPAINVIPPTPSPSIILHEDTPKTAEHIARQFKIEYAESDKSPVNGCLTQFKPEEEDPNKSSSSTSDFKLKSKIPVRSSPQCDHMQDKSPSNYPRTPRIQLRKRQTSPNNVSYECQQKEEIVVSVDNQSVQYNSPTAVSKCNTSPSKRRGLSISVVKSVSVPAVQQNVVEKACSPILLKTATTETNTDPIPVSVDASMTTDCYTPVKSDQHVQVKPESMSVALSPFCISSTDDSTKQETCDTSAMTDVVSFVSQGVMVKPVCVDTMTMTDFACKKTSETSMTPVKTLSKAGKRLTAEEVRRQHPRAIANQLDTTLVCNERLKSDLKVAEKERDRLKCIVKDLRASLSTKHKLIEELEVQKENEKTELEQMHFEVVRDFQTKIEEKDNRLMSMEQEVLDLKSLVLESEQEYKSFKSKLESQCGELQLRLESQEQQHLQQVQVMKADFESNNYKGQFERSQQMIQELQAQLDEFAGIMEDLEVTEHLQGEVHSAISETHKKLRHAGVKNAEMRKKLITEYVTMQKLKKELVTEVETHKQENQALREECESLVTSLEMSHDSITQLQSLYASTSSDLLQATSHVCQLNTELAGARKALQDFVLTKELLVQHLSDQKDKQEDLTRQLDTLSTQHCQKTQDLLEEQKRSQDWERLALEAKASLTEKCAEYELSITNLQRTLDYRDHDIDILEKDLYECREIIHEQRYQVGQMEEEFEAFKQKVHVQRVDQAELKALQDNAEFLEAERGMLIDTLRDSEEKIRSTFLQLNQQQKTLADTQVQFLEYQTTIQSLQEELSTSRLELHCTRQESQRTMLQQQGELQECREAVTGLEERMCTILGVLRMKVGVETEEDTVDAPVHSNISSESLVSKVLHAVNASIDTSEEKDASFSWSKSRPPSEEASPTEGSTSQARSSTDSGYNNSFASPGEASRSRLGFSQASAFVPVRSAPQSQSIEDEDKVQMPEDRDRVEMPNNDGRSHKSIVKQISVLSEVLSEIVSMANILEKASALSLQDLKGDNCLLREKVCWLEGEALRLQQDRVAKTEELTEANKLVEELKNRIRDMGDRIIALSDYQFENKKMHQDMMQLMGDVKRLEGEKEILEEQLAHTTPHHPGQVGNPGHSMQGQVISLKKKNQQLLIQLMEEKDRYQEMGSKAARKMKILEDNWKKAEAEVFRFDELVDSIQKILEDNREFISRNPELLLLMKVINGEDTIPSGGSLQPRASLSGPSLTRPIQRPSLAKMPKF